MPDSLSLFSDENLPDPPDDCARLTAAPDELEAVIHALIHPLALGQARAAHTAAAAARWRLTAATIVRQAIARNDDVTITRWYRPEWFAGSQLLGEEERLRADAALRRSQLLQAVRAKTVAADEQAAESLRGSNLLTRADQTIFSSITEAKQ